MRRLILAAITIVAVIPAVAHADASAKKQIQAAYDRMAAGFLRRDAKPLIAVLAPDFTNQEPGGTKQNRERFIQEMNGYMEMTKKVAVSKITIGNFAMKSGKAVADARTQMKMTVDNSNGIFGKQGKTASLEMDMIDRETWVKSGNKWLIQSSVSLPGGKMLVNGKQAGPPEG